MNLFFDPVFWIECVMLSAMLGVSLYVSYTDLTVRRVSNRCTYSLLAVGVTGQLLMIFIGVTTLNQVLMILLIGLVVGYGLHLLGLWAPGDGKLFWAVVMALPPTLCPNFDPFSLQATPIALLINALFCYFVFLLFMLFWRRVWKYGEGGPGIRQAVQAALGLAGILGIIMVFALLVLKRPLSYLETLVALIVGYRILEWVLKAQYWPIMLGPGIVSLFYLGWSTEGGPVYVAVWGATWVIEVIYQQVRHRHNRLFVQELPVHLLQAGAIPRHSLYVKEKDGLPVGIKTEEDEDYRLVCKRGLILTERQVSRLRDLTRRAVLPQGHLFEVEQSLPFVPFIAGAAVLTSFFSGTMVEPLTNLLLGLIS